MNLDDDLRRALKRQPPPAYLTDRVLARIARGDAARQEKRNGGRHVTMPLRWLAAAAALTIGVTGAARYYAYQQTLAEAARVNAQIRLALEITSEKIAMVQVRLNPDTTSERSRRNP